jgi:hypothetical protein
VLADRLEQGKCRRRGEELDPRLLAGAGVRLDDEMSLSLSTRQFRRTRVQSPRILRVGAAESAP